MVNPTLKSSATFYTLNSARHTGGAKIQRGRRERKRGKTEKEEVKEKEAAEEVVDIDLDDPEVNEAAKKMQACFKARKKTV